MREKEYVNGYIEALKKEIRMVLPLLDHNRKIAQIHYGGGTPTSQPVSVFKELNQLFLLEFDCIENLEIAIECHPGYMDEQYWHDLTEAGFNRISIGIQDFNEQVLKVVNRKHAILAIEDIIKTLREKDMSVNMDFIYGLPLQTPDSFSETIKKAVELKPDRIVAFSYAHVPWVNQLQKKLEEKGLPTVELKNEIYERSKDILLRSGYKSIGLDHFVMPEDELYDALLTKKLHRNFQGYCTRRTTGQVYAFGITGISQLATAYSQNTKDIDTYIDMINNCEYPIAKGYALNEDQQITRTVISELMCNNRINWKEIADDLHLTVERIKSALRYNTSDLGNFAKDGIIHYSEDEINILDGATPFVRNVAASFDKMLDKSNTNYSKAI
jgi:oxygen-independent coproporphyrinogen-3 oxidase